MSANQLMELVVPIAFYPDALVDEVLEASTYPTQVVEADRFMQSNRRVIPNRLWQMAPKSDLIGSGSYRLMN